MRCSIFIEAPREENTHNFYFKNIRFLKKKERNVDIIDLYEGVYCVDLGELSNEYLLAKIGFDTAENKPSKIWPACGRIMGY